MRDGDIAGSEVDDPARNEKGRDPARALLIERDGCIVDAPNAADAGPDQDARRDLVLVGLGLPAGIVEGLLGSRDGVDDEGVDLALILRVHPLVGMIGPFAASRDLACDLAGEI
jgi:hypothetical protein